VTVGHAAIGHARISHASASHARRSAAAAHALDMRLRCQPRIDETLPVTVCPT
jgi:hypothetical protein